MTDPSGLAHVVELYKLLSGATLPMLLLLILYGNFKGLWVWGWVYRKLEADAEHWKATALRQGLHADRALDVAKTVVEVPR